MKYGWLRVLFWLPGLIVLLTAAYVIRKHAAQVESTTFHLAWLWIGIELAVQFLIGVYVAWPLVGHRPLKLHVWWLLLGFFPVAFLAAYPFIAVALSLNVPLHAVYMTIYTPLPTITGLLFIFAIKPPPKLLR